MLLLVLLLTGCGPTSRQARRPVDHHPGEDRAVERFAGRPAAPRREDAQGVVTLSGTVGTQADVDRAVAVARRVPGVRDVKSELKVGGS